MKRHTDFIRLFFLLTGTGCWLFSCTRPVDLKIPQVNNKVVVNCLFNPSQRWRVSIGNLANNSDTGNITTINDAVVIIHAKDTMFHLRNIGDGKYASNNSPEAGIQYTLEVQISGHSTIFATSRIPDKCKVTGTAFDTTSTYFAPDNGFDNVRVNRINLVIQPTSTSEQYYELLAYRYNIDAYCEFVITDGVLEKLKAYRLPDFMAKDKISQEYIDRLNYLKGVRYIGKRQFLYKVAKYGGTRYWNYLVYEFAKKIRHSPKIYDSSKFTLAELFCKDLYFYNITGDSHGVFGTYSDPVSAGKDTITLFLADLSYTGNAQNGQEMTEQNEGWLEIYSLSKDMYKYQTTYINQLVNEQNPFAQPVEVYSNIHNGIGIFAGYQTERVKVH